MFCDYNTEVRTGQVCAKIDPRPYQTALIRRGPTWQSARHNCKKDEAGLAYAKVNNERNAALVETNAVSLDAANVRPSKCVQPRLARSPHRAANPMP
jgi:HlyD family secretion protein